MVNEPLFAVVFAVLCWWFGTGIILWLDRLPAWSFRWSMSAWSVLLVLSFVGIHHSMQVVSVGNAYLAFGCVIVMWGWHELAFLTGWLTGPRKVALDEGAQGWQRFAQAFQVVMHHELALVANFAVLWVMQSNHPNHLALCTFALLWCMRVSAKLNLFFGVVENGASYLPAHLTYLASYFQHRKMTVCFATTFIAACVTFGWLIFQAQQGVVAVTTGWVLLASLLGLAIVEHLLMVFPWPLQRIWGWALSRAQESNTPTLPSHDSVHSTEKFV